jgi:hypothetical protein
MYLDKTWQSHNCGTSCKALFMRSFSSGAIAQKNLYVKLLPTMDLLESWTIGLSVKPAALTESARARLADRAH